MPVYGAAVRHLWRLDPDFLTVNHGSFGATPVCVLEAQSAWRERMEAQPSRFMRRELGPALRSAAGHLATFVGADPDDLVFVENATSGCNTVLRSLAFVRHDEIVVLDHGYGAVRNAAAYVAERAQARLVTATLPFPAPTDAGVEAAIAACLTLHTRLVILDHVTSPSAIVLPLARLIRLCHAAGSAVLVDGAHGPGQVDLNLDALGADYYTGNCHKWLMAPKGSGFLHVRRDRQQGMHPLAISHGYQQGYLAEFDWTGTTDFTAYLAVPEAIAFHARLGGAELRARNAAMAADGAHQIAARLGTATSAPETAPAAMSLVRLPPAQGDLAQLLARLRAAFLDHATDAPLHALAGAIWVRLSAQAYNQPADYDRLADVVASCIAASNADHFT